MSHSNKNRNYMRELRDLLCQLRSTKMEPEFCNISCPPLGCPRGPCLGMCLDERGLVDPCCFSKMPTCGSAPPPPPPPQQPRTRPKHSCCGRH